MGTLPYFPGTAVVQLAAASPEVWEGASLVVFVAMTKQCGSVDDEVQEED